MSEVVTNLITEALKRQNNSFLINSLSTTSKYGRKDNIKCMYVYFK